jgi:hypothetical protein
MSLLTLSYEGVAAPDAWPVLWDPSTYSVGWDLFRMFGPLRLVLARRTHRKNLTYKYIIIS